VYAVTDSPLDPQSITESVYADECGAVITFLGTVRSPSDGHDVVALEYEAYPEMAEAKMEEIGRELAQRWGIERIAMVHRTGRLVPGEISLVIALAAPHRQEAFSACEYAVERLKEIVPIWKKEIWQGGEVWIEGPHVSAKI
jgi:molybdopterin synthase catalytic subunit